VATKAVFSPYEEEKCKEEKPKLSLIRFLPILAMCSPILTFLGSYVLSVLNGHYPAALPYISHTGNEPPGSGVFTFGICLTCLFLLPTVFLQYQRLIACITVVLGDSESMPSGDMSLKAKKPKYRFFSYLYEKYISTGESVDLEESVESKDPEEESVATSNTQWWYLTMNRAALLSGVTGIFGMLIVGSFQESKMSQPHYIGAIIAFVSVVLYITLISLILFKIRYHYYRTKLFLFRLILNMNALVVFFCMIGFGLTYAKLIPENLSKKESHNLKFDQNGNVFPFFVATSTCEWLLALNCFTYCGTFYFDFKHISLDIMVNVRKVPGVKNELALLR
jgi:hypothetical protein